MNIFASGSCRIFHPLFQNEKKYNLEILHGIDKFYGKQALGYLHDTKSHIQFLKMLRKDIIIPDDILNKFLTVYSPVHFPEPEMYVHKFKIENINKKLPECGIFVFEICSIKIYEHISLIDNQKYNIHGHNLNPPLKIPTRVQTKQEIIDDLNVIISLCPDKSIFIFQCHIRPRVVWKSEYTSNREFIYETLSEFVKDQSNMYLIDPSFENLSYYENENYFTPLGIDQVAQKYDKIFKQITNEENVHNT